VDEWRATLAEQTPEQRLEAARRYMAARYDTALVLPPEPEALHPYACNLPDAAYGGCVCDQQCPQYEACAEGDAP
jgi:hypothetical protein